VHPSRWRAEPLRRHGLLKPGRGDSDSNGVLTVICERYRREGPVAGRPRERAWRPSRGCSFRSSSRSLISSKISLSHSTVISICVKRPPSEKRTSGLPTRQQAPGEARERRNVAATRLP
jgi:hypothetical protein